MAYIDPFRNTTTTLPGDPVLQKLEGSTRYQSLPINSSMGGNTPVSNVNPPVSNGLLKFPSDLFVSPEHMFGIRFEIWDTDGQALGERRKVTSGLENMVKDATQKAREGREPPDPNNPPQEGDTLSLIGTGISALASLAGGLASSFTPLIDAITSSETQFDPASRTSFVEAATGLGGGTSLKKTVYLYLPGGIKFGDKFDYEDADMSGVDFIRGIKGAFGYGNSEAQGEIMRKIGMGAVKIADEIAESIGGKEFFQNYAKASTRQVENPFLVHLFKGVQRRQFTFDFVLVPRSEQEAVSIQSIVKTFREYAHPSRTSGGRFLNFPAEFNLAFLYQSNDGVITIPKIKKCALTGITVDYGETIFTAHTESASGIHPTQVKLSLEFSELEILARQEVERGY